MLLKAYAKLHQSAPEQCFSCPTHYSEPTIETFPPVDRVLFSGHPLDKQYAPPSPPRGISVAGNTAASRLVLCPNKQQNIRALRKDIYYFGQIYVAVKKKKKAFYKQSFFSNYCDFFVRAFCFVCFILFFFLYRFCYTYFSKNAIVSPKNYVTP